jgi:hypothetical protein
VRLVTAEVTITAPCRRAAGMWPVAYDSVTAQPETWRVP